MANTNYQNVGYSLTQGPLTTLSPVPVIAKVVPTANNLNYMPGQLWIVPSVPSAYILVKVASGVATWQLIEASGSAGAFTTLTSTGNTSLATAGTATVNLATTSTGAVNIGNATGGTNVTGALTATSLATTTTINSGGVITAASSSPVTAGGVVYLNLGNGGTSPQILAGSGVPTASAPVGSLYLRTDGSSTSTRLYVATTTGGVWTNVVTAA